MAHTQMTDHNPSNLGLMEELTDKELSAINGGSCCCTPQVFTYTVKPVPPPKPGQIKPGDRPYIPPLRPGQFPRN